MLDHDLARRTAQQPLHAVDGDTNLLVAGHRHAKDAHELRDALQVEDEEREVAEGESTLAHGAGGEDQDDAGADVDGVVIGGALDLLADAILERGRAANLVQALEFADNLLLAAGHLDALGGAESLGHEADHARCGAAAYPAVVLDALVRQVGDERDQHQGREGHHGDERVDAHHEVDGHQRGDAEADQHLQQAEEHPDFFEVAAEATDRFAG